MHAEEPKLADGELVRLSTEGSREAFSLLVTRYARTVRAVFLARLGRHRDLEDMVQETFLRAFRGLSRLQQRDRFAPYLHRIAQNLSVDHLRRPSRQARSLDEVDLEPVAATATGDPDEDRMQRLRQQVGRLPEALREAVLLFYFENLSYAQMAQLLGVTEAAVNQRLSRARRRLRDGLGVNAEQSP